MYYYNTRYTGFNVAIKSFAFKWFKLQTLAEKDAAVVTVFIQNKCLKAILFQ